jgi:hypothetical protein
MNEHGRDLGHGQLDDVFGITRIKGQSKGRGAEGVASEPPLRLEGKSLNVAVGDETVSAAAGKPLARSGDIPLVISNHFGQGKSVFLNLEVANYAYDRLQAKAQTSLPDLLEGVLGLAGIEPALRVLDASGKRLPGTEVVRFSNGSCEHVAIFRNPQFDDGGWGNLPTAPERGWAGEIDNTLLESEAHVTVTWLEAQQAYDVRGKRDLGETAKVEAVLDPWSPLVITRSPKPIPELRVQVPEQVQAGAALAVTLRDDAPVPEGTSRVLRLEFVTSAGTAYDLYARNILVATTPHVERFDFALNDPGGQWQLSAHDLITGRVAQAVFTVRA